jgi:glycosyltransferase involved in cell wall biosynthesis
VKLGHRVQILSGSYSHLYTNPPQVTQSFSKEKIDGIDYIWVKVPKYKQSISIGRVINMLAFAWNIRKASKVLEPPDIIVVSSPSLFPIWNALDWKRRWSCKFYFEVRDVWPLTLNMLSGLSAYHPFSMFLSCFEKMGYKNADKVVSLLPGTKNYMISKGMKPHKFVWIPNGIVLPEGQNRQLPDNLKENLKSEKFKVGYAGGMGKANALEYLIEAANLLCEDDNIEFVLIGNGDDQEKLKQLCKGNNVRFLGTLPHDQINGFLKEMDVCYIGWHKNKLYQLGISANKIYDYLYSAIPIIHSVEAYNDPIQEAGAGISISPESPEKIKNAILEMKNCTVDKRAKMGEQGRQYVLNNFTYKQLALNYLKELKNGK